jgi:hypothetical protein
VRCAKSQRQLQLHPDYVYRLFSVTPSQIVANSSTQWPISVVPKVCSLNPKGFTTSFQGIHGYTSVMATFTCTHFFNYKNNVLSKIIEELNQLVICLFQMTIRISNYETFCTHKARNNHLIKVKLCKTLLLMLPVCICIYLKSVLGYIFFIFGYLWFGHYIYISKDVRIHNYFWKPKRVHEQQHFWNTDLHEFFVTIFAHKFDTNITTHLIFWQQPEIKQTINKLHQLQMELEPPCLYVEG